MSEIARLDQANKPANVGNDQSSDDEGLFGNPKYLTFNIHNRRYGISIETVKEIIEYPVITRIPMTTKCIRGVTNLRGNVVPVIDLAVRLGQTSGEASKWSCVIVVEGGSDGEHMDIGFVVDSVDAVLDIPHHDIRDTPDFGIDIRSEFISGMGRFNDDFVVLINLGRVLSVQELAGLAVANRN